MRESEYQAQLVKTLNSMFTGCLVLRNAPDQLQGIPDLLILFEDRWAMLEVKLSFDAPYQPNQEYYIEVLDGMSFAAMICPENEEDVLYDLQRAFKTRRASRIS